MSIRITPSAPSPALSMILDLPAAPPLRSSPFVGFATAYSPSLFTRYGLGDEFTAEHLAVQYGASFYPQWNQQQLPSSETASAGIAAGDRKTQMSDPSSSVAAAVSIGSVNGR